MSGLTAWITAQWVRRGWGARLMWPLHLLMLALVRLRRQLFAMGWLSTTRLAVPVLVVGNRVVGGAGKTPTTLAVLAHLQARGHRPGVLSRGHGRMTTGDRPDDLPLLLDTQSASALSAREVGDEPWLIWRRAQVPMAIHASRGLAGQALLVAHPEIDILVCDDGLQHLALARDVEVVVFDERGAGNGWLLPAGPLREPIDAPTHPGMRMPPLVLYNAPHASTDLPGHLVHKKLGAPRPWADWLHGKWPSDEALATQLEQLHRAPAPEVWAIAGIAQPSRFFEGLSAQGWHFTPCPLADHDALAVLPWPTTARHVLMTEKDAVKIRSDRVQAHSPGVTLWVVGLDFQPDADFWQALDLRLPPAPSLPPTPGRWPRTTETPDGHPTD
jgi:tetraacyldisaccharide 4'-kinase